MKHEVDPPQKEEEGDEDERHERILRENDPVTDEDSYPDNDEDIPRGFPR
ncbi:hypothetical protein IPM62_05340 [Candidatus Woesebacteria bacterium]|nr:MAG: hypothetical protein IPM62_05340 [Candidatus Woesebacteria bacterium]